MVMGDDSKRCRCGHDRSHVMVSAEGEYTLGGWICHSVGITTAPKKINFRCRVCREVVDETTDADDLTRIKCT